jgi:hypothetical protein
MPAYCDLLPKTVSPAKSGYCSAREWHSVQRCQGGLLMITAHSANLGCGWLQPITSDYGRILGDDSAQSPDISGAWPLQKTSPRWIFD